MIKIVDRVKINPQMLKWARLDAGYTENNLPKHIKKNYKKWEQGSMLPTWNQLRILSHQYKRPTAFFFRNNPPKQDKINIIDYRKDDINKDYISPQLTLAIRDAKNKRKIYLELLNEMKYPVTNFTQNIKTKNTTKDIINNLRTLLNVTIDEQKTWIYNSSERKDYKHYNYLNQWKDNISNLGILIFEAKKINSNEMRALSLYYYIYPIIILNASNSVNDRIFSLIHELIHLFFKQNTICDFNNENNIESFCNKIAIDFLVPTNNLNQDKSLKNHSLYWEEYELNNLSNEYGVSKELILQKLLTLNKTNNEFINQKKIEWYQIKSKTNSGGSPVLNQVKYNGKLYSKLILTAYEENIISYSEFSKDMGLKLKHIINLEHYLFR